MATSHRNIEDERDRPAESGAGDATRRDALARTFAWRLPLCTLAELERLDRELSDIERERDRKLVVHVDDFDDQHEDLLGEISFAHLLDEHGGEGG